jgi:hypothetical protein
MAASRRVFSEISGTGGIDIPFFDSEIHLLKRQKLINILKSDFKRIFITQKYEVHSNKVLVFEKLLKNQI